MNDNLTALIQAAKFNPDIFKSEYIFTKNESESINQLIKKIKDDNFSNPKEKGDALESLIDQIFKTHQIYKVKRNLKTTTNEIDLFLELDFFGNQINNVIEKECLPDEVLVECKNYGSKLNVSWIGKFASLMRVSKLTHGFFMTKEGITGQHNWDASKGLIRKLALKDESIILDFLLTDFKDLEGKTLVDLIRLKRQSLILDVEIEALIETHDLESLI